MAAIPPCRSVLKLHSMRANTIEAIWKRPTSPMIVATGIAMWLGRRHQHTLDHQYIPK